MTITTTDRPLSNDDRKEICEGRNDSPPVEQPQRVSFLSVIRDALGLCLAVGIPVALVCIAAALVETGI